MAKQVNSRTRQKYDTLEHWALAPKFIPLDGELIVITNAFSYTDEQGNTIVTPGIKAGDGKTFLKDLPYINTNGKNIVKLEELTEGFKVTLSDGFEFTLKHGLQGNPGEKGEAATITIGTVTTGNAGTDATITNSGNKNNAVFNFTIPRGADGLPGEDGATAGFGTITATVDDTTGTPNVEVITSGDNTAKNIQFAFSGLKGASGGGGAIDLPLSKGTGSPSL